MNLFNLFKPKTAKKTSVSIEKPTKLEIPKDSPFYMSPKAIKALSKVQSKVIYQLDLSYLDYLTKDVVKSLMDLLIEDVVEGVSDSKFNKAIQSLIPVEYHGESKKIRDTMRNQYYQGMEDLTAEQNLNDGMQIFWEYVGVEDNKNRDECIWALNKRFFTEEERKEFESKTGIRIGCRHIFIQVAKVTFEEGEKPENDLNENEINRRIEVIDRMKEIYG